MDKIKIGYIGNTYAERRNIIDKVNVSYSYTPSARYINKISKYLRIIEKLDVIYKDISLFHYFNKVSFGSKPWVSTFETIIPRYMKALSCHHGKNPSYAEISNDKDILFALDAIAGENCRKLISLSECNLNIQKYFLSFFDPIYSKSIIPKMIVITPPQNLNIKNWEEKNINLNGELTFTFIGRDFAQKGGCNILRVFTRLKKYYPIKLIIISSLNVSNYVVGENEDDINRVREIIQDNKDWVEFYSSLPNNEVIEIMKRSHIGLLPTWADTFGYSVLEFQSCGCPVITTDVRALPEINNDERGWVISVPKNVLGEGIYLTNDERQAMSDTIDDGLYKVIKNIFHNRTSLLEKAKMSILNIEINHSESIFSDKLKEIYFEALCNPLIQK
ncbi:glycosyltransferase family 4 protein [uncultured Pontibacter sp.]|uniref:glycosyltransferase family 4 protein n=1 Tax=uncultured Pontibacter sp. TaxID=453356 RepID=UPI00262AE4CB|nr:glycosyltransferase family 4 protein [uncultured Pontibacter sp.]